MRVIDRIGVPTLIITAADDPFVPPGPFREPAVVSNRNITSRITPHGGHCGFVEEVGDGYDGYWAEREIVAFLKKHCSSKLGVIHASGGGQPCRLAPAALRLPHFRLPPFACRLSTWDCDLHRQSLIPSP